MGGDGPTGIRRQAAIRAPLYVAIIALVFVMTALIGGVVGFWTLSKSEDTINDITFQIREAILKRASEEVNNTLIQAQQVLEAKAHNQMVFDFINRRDRSNVLANMDVYHYQIASPFSFLENAGIVFQADSNGNQTYMAAYTRAELIYFQDVTTAYSLYSAAVLGSNQDSSIVLNNTYKLVRRDAKPNSQWPALKTNGIKTGRPFWAGPLYTPVLKTFLIPYFWPVWQNLTTGVVGTGDYYAAHFVMLSIGSLDAFLQTVQITPNGVVSLIDGNTGQMLASSVAGISQNGTGSTTFPAIGNPNRLVSAAASYLASTYGNGTIQSVPATEDDLALTFKGLGDEILVNAVWLSDADTGLRWLLVLAIPSNDFLAVTRATMQQTIIFICVFCFVALAAAVLMSWSITSPLRRLSTAMSEATRFDFSALRNGYLDQRSVVSEIGQLQGAFNEMMIKFASGIEKNKALLTKNLGSAAASNPSLLNDKKQAAINAIQHELEKKQLDTIPSDNDQDSWNESPIKPGRKI
ncbi:hypothetical protein HK101_003204 [Irineochytrium annulatum]|nr:hypothetical protein HK101_003204 [Irineochytrium annulatum]